MTRLFNEYSEHEEPLTHEFFNTLYWRTFQAKSRQPEIGERGFLGIIKGLANRNGFGIGGGENSGIRCTFYDNNDNKLEEEVLFAFDPSDWEERKESLLFISNSEFLNIMYNVFSKYKNLQERRWFFHPEIKKIEEKEIDCIKNILNSNFRKIDS